LIFLAQNENGMIQPDVVFFRRPSTALSFAQSSNSDRRTSNSSEILGYDQIETIDDMSVRLTSPIKPLVPAYQLSEPLVVSSVRLPQILYQNQNDEEFALPPGYMNTLLNRNQKN